MIVTSVLVQNLCQCERPLLEYTQTRVYWNSYTGTRTRINVNAVNAPLMKAQAAATNARVARLTDRQSGRHHHYLKHPSHYVDAAIEECVTLTNRK